MSAHAENNMTHLLSEAWQLRGIGNYEDSKRVLKSAEALCHPDDFYFLGRIYHIKMQYEADSDNYLKAIEYCKLAVSTYKKSKDSTKIAHSMRHLADLYLEINQLADAEVYYNKVLHIYESLKDVSHQDFANALRGYALLHEKQNKIAKAISLWEQITELYRKRNFAFGEQEGIKKVNDLKNIK